MSKLREAAFDAMAALKEFNGAVTETGWKIDFQAEIDLLLEALREDALEKLTRSNTRAGGDHE
jgi:hypothetical protein